MKEDQEILNSQLEQLKVGARNLALKFEEVLPKDKKWFKPIHLKRLLRGENESSIKEKLEVLVGFELATKKSEGGDEKYKLIVTKQQRIEFCEEYLEHLKSEQIRIQEEIKNLSE